MLYKEAMQLHSQPGWDTLPMVTVPLDTSPYYSYDYTTHYDAPILA